MEYKDILNLLKQKSEGDDFKNFTQKIVNSASQVIGVKTIHIKNLAKQIASDKPKMFLDQQTLPFYEQKLLYGFVLAYAKLTVDEFINYLNFYLNIIDSWALVDSPICVMKIIQKNKSVFFDFLVSNLKHTNPYACRFSIIAFFKFYLTDDYINQIINIYKNINSSEYYINIGLSWGVCEILIKNYKKGVELLSEKSLPTWIQNKSIQKACESFRLNLEQKAYLKTLKK